MRLAATWRLPGWRWPKWAGSRDAELGDFGTQFHAALSEPIIAADVDYAVLVGEEMGALARELGKPQSSVLGKPIAWAHCQTADEAIELLEDFGVVAGDAVLVKGSNSVGLGRLVDHFTRAG